MTFTSDSGQTFEATIGSDGIPTFLSAIPKDDGEEGDTVTIPTLAEDEIIMKLNPNTWDGGSNNYAKIYLDEAVSVDDTYKIHLVGKSDKAIGWFGSSLQQENPWDNLDDYSGSGRTIPANTDFDITFYLQATKSCDLNGKPNIEFAASKNEQAVDRSNPVTLTLTKRTITKMDGIVRVLNLRTGYWDGGSSSNNETTIPSDEAIGEAITADSTYKIHLVGQSDQDITRLGTDISQSIEPWETFAEYVFYESPITANTDFDITLTMTATKACALDLKPVFKIAASREQDWWEAVDFGNSVKLILTTFTIEKQP